MPVSTRLSLITGIFLVTMVSVAGAFQGKDGSPLPTQEEREVLRNEYGLVILDSSGHRLNYSKEELQTQGNQTPVSSPDSKSVISLGAEPVWGYAAFGTGIGKSNIIVALNGDLPEVYLGGFHARTFGLNDYWYALRYSAATNGYKQVYVSQYYPAGIIEMEVADIVGDSRKEILIALENGEIHLYNQANKAWLGKVNTAASGLTGMEVADLDGNGEKEIILCTSGHLYVYSRNGVLKWDMAGIGGSDVVVAQMDADTYPEIAVTSGRIIDTSTRSVQWTWPDGFGAILRAADIDDDNMDELIAAESWYFVWAYDVDRQLPKWSIPISHDIGAIHVTDIDADLVQELLVGEGQWGEILAYDTVTQELEWSIANPEHGVTNIAIGDSDGDGVTELLWGAGATSTGEDHLYVANWLTEQIEWQNIHLDGPFIGPELGDLDGNGRDEIVVVSWESDSGYGSGRILVFDSRTFRLRAISDEIVSGLSWTGTHDLKLRDVDDDGRLEILVAADRLYDGVIEIYDFDVQNNFTLNWTNATRPEGASFYSVDAADIDNDGDIEIVGGAGREHTGAQGVFVYVYAYTTGAEEWHSLQMGDYWDAITALGLSDVDQDGSEEILGMVNAGNVYIFDGLNKSLEAILTGTYTALQVNQNRRAAPSIFLGSNSGDLSIYRYQLGSYNETYRQNLVSGSIDGFTIRSKNSIWIGSEGILSAVTLSGTTLWNSSSYGQVFGTRTAFMTTAPIFLSAGTYSVIGFRSDTGTSSIPDP